MAEKEKSLDYGLTFLLEPKGVPLYSRHAGAVAIIAKDPGPASVLASVAGEFLLHGYPVWVTATETAVKRIAENFPDNISTVGGRAVPKGIENILLSADQKWEFELKHLKLLISANPKAKISIIEDFPGSIGPMIEKVSDIHPVDLVLTTTIEQAERYGKEFPEIKTIFPIGQPSFDSLLSEDVAPIGEATREILLGNIPDSERLRTKIITFFGDFGDDSRVTGFNDKTLKVVLEVMEGLKENTPLKNILFVYRPHPRESNDRWTGNPVIKEFRLNPKSTIPIVTHPPNGWEHLGITTRDLCIASDLIINLSSTVGIEQLLSTTVRQNQSRFGKSIPLFITLQPLTGDFYYFAEDLKKYAPVAETKGEVYDKIEKLLTDTAFSDQYRKKIMEMKLQYRFKSSASIRAFYHISRGLK